MALAALEELAAGDLGDLLHGIVVDLDPAALAVDLGPWIILGTLATMVAAVLPSS